MTVATRPGAHAGSGGTAPVRAATRVLAPARLRRLVARGVRVRVGVAGTSLRPVVCPGDRVTLAAGAPRRGGLVAVSTPVGLELRRCLGRPADDVLAVSGPGGSEEALPESALAGVVVRLERRGRVVPAHAPGLAAAIARGWRALTGRLSRRAA